MRAQDGASCLWAASHNGHTEIVKYLHKVSGKELLMMTRNVSEDVGCVLVGVRFFLMAYLRMGVHRCFFGCCSLACMHVHVYSYVLSLSPASAYVNVLLVLLSL